MRILPVILSGGSGTRLWPLSRTAYPKQLLPLHGEGTLLQQTAGRLNIDDCDVLDPVILCNESQRFMIAEQLRQIGVEPSLIALEPAGRNTAPAIAIPALWVKQPEDTVMVVMSSDHFIDNAEAFSQIVLIAATEAMTGRLMTIGINPTEPHTGYGYIKKGAVLSDGQAYVVDSFKEKPDQATAQSYIDTGDYLWNSGIFAFRADRYLEELKDHQPEVLSACQAALSNAEEDHDFMWLDKDSFEKAPNISVDYAVMEHAKSVGVVPSSFEWSDVGSWRALWTLGDKDPFNNAITGDVLISDVSNSYIKSTNKLVTVLGLSDVCVVETEDVVFVSHMNRVDEVKDFVEELNSREREETITHPSQRTNTTDT